MKRVNNKSKQIERFIRCVLHKAQHKALREANEQQASAASITSTNAVLATLVHKFSQDFTLSATFALPAAVSLPLAAFRTSNYQKFWNKYDADADFKKLVQQSVVRNKRGAYLGLINAEALREFLAPEFAAACGEHDVLIETYDDRYIWHKIDAQKLAQIVAIAENADELRALLQRAGTKI